VKKVTIADYGIGNLLSVKRALMHCGAEVILAQSPEAILEADSLVVPGVGAFRKCMEAIEHHGLKESLIEFAASGRPYLGICVGMQMLLDCSHEFGTTEGLGLIPGEVRKIEIENHPVPIIGWKETLLNRSRDKYYFIHSFQAKPEKEEDILSIYQLGKYEIVASVKRDNITGVQFHPEKSGEAGINFLKGFLSL